MLKNYLMIAIRNITKHKSFSAINVAGLAVGIACCIAIMLFVRDELRYDRFNKHADRIYRVHFHAFFNGKDLNFAGSAAPLSSTLLRDFPEVVAATRIARFGSPVLRYGDKAFSEEKFFWADSTFFEVFTVHFAEGDPKTALTQPNCIIITEAMAKKYFDNEDPMGKILNADRVRDYVVTGVVDGFPRSSHFQFDFLSSLATRSESRDQIWVHPTCYTYALLREGTDPSAFEQKMNEDLKTYMGPQIKAVSGLTFIQFESKGNQIGFYLQPLTSIHLHSHLDYEIEPNGDIAYVYVFSAIGVAILLIACINFMNLSTARSERRAREVGIRKTLGSNRGKLVMQFMTESTIMSLIAVCLAVVLVELFLPSFGGMFGKQLSLDLLSNPFTILFLALAAIVVGVLSGSYPSFYLSSFMPVHILKSDGGVGSRRPFLRSALVVSQFIVSIVLFASTLVIYNQLRYIQDKNLGFNKEQVVVVGKADNIGLQIESFENELRANPSVLSVTNSSDVPGNQNGNNTFTPEGGTISDARSLRTMICDYDFAQTYKMDMVAGRFFSKEHPSDSMAVVLNEAAVKSLGLKNPIGTNLIVLNGLGDRAPKLEIIGVMRDFNYQSLHEEIRPLIVGMFPRGRFGRFVSVRIAPDNYASTISLIENSWKKYAGNETFEANFLNQNLEDLYRADIRASRITALFSILAIFIACLGLLGLAAFITEQRTKEIGIRKVLGASVAEVIRLLSAQFVKWVLIANVIAWPLAYYVMNSWLQNFAYRIDLSLWIFAVSGALTLIVALLTVSSHAIRAATANPVESLHYE